MEQLLELAGDPKAANLAYIAGGGLLALVDGGLPGLYRFFGWYK